MADLSILEEIWRQSLKLNLRFYGAVTQSTATYVKDLATLFADLRDMSPKPQKQTIIETPSAPQASQQTNAPSQKAGVMVLEGEAGSTALGVFLVANNLGHNVSTRVVASEFIDANGHIVQSAFTFDPEVVRLAPNEQLLVRVTTEIDNLLEPEVRYAGEFTIPELSGTRIPIVLRRRLDEEKLTDDAQAVIDINSDKHMPPGRSRKNKSSTSASSNGG